MGIVSQEPVLFATSIGENIRLGAKHGTDGDITQKDVETAAKQANCYDFISQLPEVCMYIHAYTSIELKMINFYRSSCVSDLNTSGF